MSAATAVVVKEEPEGSSRFRKYRGLPAAVVRAISVLLSLYVIVDTLNLPYTLGIVYYRGQHNALFLCFVLVLIFALRPAGKGAPKDKLPWYDWLLILGSIVGTLYIYLNFEAIGTMHSAWATPLEQVLGVITLFVVLEAVRRTIGWAMVILALIFFLYVSFGYVLPASVYVPKFSFARLMATFYIFPSGIFGTILEMAATLIFVFIIFGAFLQASGAANFFVKLALALVGNIRGGPAKVAVIASALFGTLSGSPAANVAVTGSITIPMMKSIGYPAYFAGAVESVASTGGAIMPPVMGVVAFLIADFTGVSYGKVCITAALPALLYFLCCYLQVDFQAIKLGLRGLPRKDLPRLGETLKEGWPFMLPLLVLVFLLMILEYDPLVSALYALGALVLVGMFREDTRLGPRKIVSALESGARTILDTGALCALAGIIVASVTITGLGVRLSSLLLSVSGGNLWVLLLLTALACYVMGMGISSITAYILLSVLVVPALISLGVPVLAAHLFVFYMGTTTMFTPPFCPAVFVAVSIAGSTIFKTGFQSMRLGIVLLFVPFVFAVKPGLLLMGPPVGVVWAALTCIVGVVAIAMGVEGYMLRPASMLERVALCAGALLLITIRWELNLLGAAIVGGAVVSHCLRVRRLSVIYERQTSPPNL
jgi:TRAP transporter 4TM/12TM fusion protein